ncbi:hypothetical protein N2384_05125 [Bacillus paralicheniformis]|uniref:hypothetical protein n=1 Tax=Bacillus paralicheniformis TaxID=1648923 RepID=UPI0021A59954|nr:hypothetical protein [Bacillus paralicheniformis]UWS62510.1 hypothetical protein N2384_05125 [Bacillus paralicheniformis]
MNRRDGLIKMRKRSSLLMLAFVLALSMLLTACGSGGAGGSESPGKEAANPGKNKTKQKQYNVKLIYRIQIFSINRKPNERSEENKHNWRKKDK